MEKLTEWQGEPIEFVETMHVKEGVTCDVYRFTETDEKDLGVVTVAPGEKTPLQRVLKGTETIEGFMSGKGVLCVTDNEGVMQTSSFVGDMELAPVSIKVGELIQWCADKDDGLVFYEICYPPYEDGRYENLEE